MSGEERKQNHIKCLIKNKAERVGERNKEQDTDRRKKSHRLGENICKTHI